jgi:hypothetical protein
MRQTWKTAWDIVQRANRPNLGLCLDTFQTVGSEWADPTTKTGLIETLSLNALQEGFHSSAASETVPVRLAEVTW